MFTAASLLFVPGSRPDRFPKAKAAGAGLTVIDLEDAVASEDKEQAREAALAHIAEGPDGWGIRINAVTTLAGVRDLAALGDVEVLPSVLMVPMVEAVAELDVVVGALGERCPDLVPLVETPRGLRHALNIVSHPKVSALMLGGADFSSELGVELAWDPLLGARHAMVFACAEGGKPAIDVPYIHLDDEEGFAAECARASALGFQCKAVIHPRQVSHANAAFAPSEAEIIEAREALEAYKAGGERAIRFKGKMLEAPFVKKYRAVLARAENAKGDPSDA
jgi:citrate lyase subunit beta/citryl-CoA lyase/(S)-citramalyl-CoA lyase